MSVCRRWSFVLLIAAVAMAGCASTPKVARMVPQQDDVRIESTGATLVVGEVRGGEESTAWKGSKINASNFRQALLQTLRQSILFTTVVSDGEADYELSSTLLAQEQPSMGMSMTVNMVVRYRLTDRATGESVLDQRIASTYKAGFGEALVGTARLRKANEGAVRENLKLLLERMDELSLGTERVSRSR